MRGVLTVVGVLLASPPAPAHTDADPAVQGVPQIREAPPRQVVITGQAGSNTPLGFYGLALDVEILPRWLSVSGGVGMDLQDVQPALRLALMPRARFSPWGGATSVSGGLGISYGKSGASADPSYRLNGDLAVAYRLQGGLSLGAFGGIALPVISPDGSAPRMPYAGVALGYALSPNPIVARDQSLSLRRWYGWQILALDSLAALIPWASFQDPVNLGQRHVGTRAGIGIYVVSGPLVHFAHRRYRHAGASAGLRALGPLCLGWLGSEERIGESGSSNNLLLPGLVVGAAVAALVDAIVLGWEQPEHPPAL